MINQTNKLNYMNRNMKKEIFQRKMEDIIHWHILTAGMIKIIMIITSKRLGEGMYTFNLYLQDQFKFRRKKLPKSKVLHNAQSK
jgi:hypothetical protein